MTKKLKLVFADNSDLIISLNNSVTANKLVNMSKHLQRVPLRFCNYDNPFCYTLPIANKQLIETAELLDINIDQTQLTDQYYLNSLHKLYEQSYNGTEIWLRFHEAIHMLEQISSATTPPAAISYGETAGLLNVKYSYQELQTCQSTFAAGDCFVSFSELGKSPYSYWIDDEPDDFDRLVELSKPMIRLHFRMLIALTEIDRTPSEENQSKFETWFAPHKRRWCDHWGIPDWTITQMLGGIKVGSIDNIESLIKNLKNNVTPSNLLLLND
jgi:hypothetical protein